MPVGVKSWSTTAATNASASSAVNWAEGQLAPTLNNSARALMAEVAAWRLQFGGISYGGAGNAYTATNNAVGTWSAYAAGDFIGLLANHTNSGAATINVDGLGAKNIITNDGGALISGDITSGALVLLLYDGTSFQLVGSFASGSYQPLDATLSALAGVTTAANKLVYATGADAFATTDLTAAGRAILDDADATAQRTTLGFSTLTDYVTLTGTQTLTNKTLSSPTLSGTISGSAVTWSGGSQTWSSTPHNYTSGSATINLGNTSAGSLNIGNGTNSSTVSSYSAKLRLRSVSDAAGVACLVDTGAEIAMRATSVAASFGTFTNHDIQLFTNSAQVGKLTTTGNLTTTGSYTAMSGTAIPAGGTIGAGLMVSSTAEFGVFFGSGVPTLSAAQGSLYMRSDGSSTSTRMYVNTDGSDTWTAVTTAA